MAMSSLSSSAARNQILLLQEFPYFVTAERSRFLSCATTRRLIQRIAVAPDVNVEFQAVMKRIGERLPLEPAWPTVEALASASVQPPA